MLSHETECLYISKYMIAEKIDSIQNYKDLFQLFNSQSIFKNIFQNLSEGEIKKTNNSIKNKF